MNDFGVFEKGCWWSCAESLISYYRDLFNILKNTIPISIPKK